MAIDDKISTGEIAARDYGVILQVGKNKIFLSPAKYAIAKVMLESRREIRERIRSKALEEGVEYSGLEAEVIKGVIRKEGTKNLLNFHGRSSLQRVRLYGNRYSAEVKSKSRRKSAFYGVQLVSPEIADGRFRYGGARCDCEDSFWDEAKNVAVMCPHLAVLESALYLDGIGRKSSFDNYTGLRPKERPENVSMPFRILEKKRGEVTDVLFDYYPNGRRYLEIDKELLKDGSLYSAELMDALRNDRAAFCVLRQREKEVCRDSISQYKRRFYGAVKALEKRMVKEFEERGFAKAGYGLEFKGTEYEVVAQRFRRGYQVYELCIRDGGLPVIVKKYLGGKIDNWTDGDDRRDDNPFTRKGEYLTVDDSTRRECLARVIFPGMGKESIIRLPGILRDRYESMLRG